MSKKGTKAFDAEWIVILAPGVFFTEQGTTTDLDQADGRKTRREAYCVAEIWPAPGLDGPRSVIRRGMQRNSNKESEG